jgi:hypothetical protein
MKKIIAALDFSSANPVVMEHAISLAKSKIPQLGARCCLVVWPRE